jgi:negative regulator of flagellin synthesis FlgM
MRIDLNTKSTELPDANQVAKTASQSAPETASGKAPSIDTTRLSIAQGRVQALAAQVNKLPDVRQEKVAALGRAVQSGTYQVTPEQTADALLSELRTRPAA